MFVCITPLGPCAGLCSLRLISPSPNPQFCTRPLRGCSNNEDNQSLLRTFSSPKQTVLKVCTEEINMSGITLYYASVYFTQSGTARGAMRRDVTIEFHAVLWNGPIRIVVGQIRHKCAWAIAAHFFACFALSPSIRSSSFKDGCCIEELSSDESQSSAACRVVPVTVPIKL